MSALSAALEMHGLTVWVDDRLVAGAHYDVAIEEALAEADKVIVAWSPSASVSQWVRAEAGDGLERGILVPVLIEPTKIPLEFRRIQTVDLTGWEGDAHSADLGDLLVALKGQPRARARRSEEISRGRWNDKGTGVSAEVLGASKYFFNVRMRVQIGQKSFSVRHTNRLIHQVIKVDGRVVSRSPFGFLHDHHSFMLPAPDGEHRVDLFIRGDPTSGINGVSINIDGRDVLRQRVGWTDGLAGFIGYGSLALVTAYYWSMWFDLTFVGILGLFTVVMIITVIFASW